MKRTYISPVTIEVKINARSCILNGSSIDINSTGDPVDAGDAAAPSDFDYDFDDYE